MSTVHATATKTTLRATTVRSRRKNPGPITCSGCGASASGHCLCLEEWHIHRETVPLLQQLFESGTDLVKRREARQALVQIVAQAEQRTREREALRAFCRAHVAPKPFSANRDRQAICHMMGEFTGVVGCGEVRSVERTAELFRRPVAYLKDLRASALRALHAPARGASASTASRRAVA